MNFAATPVFPSASKVWFVTGCSRGLGLAINEQVLSSEALLIAIAHKPEQLKPLVDRFGADKIFPVALNSCNKEDVFIAVQAGYKKFCRIHVVVNNAGYGDVAAVDDVIVEDFRLQIETNSYGVVYVCKAVPPILREQGFGHIFQVSSLGGRIGVPDLAAYQSAKWEVGGFSTVLAQEAAPLGIKATVLEPGGMKTDWAGSSMNIPLINEAYRQTVGAFVEMIKEGSGKELTLPEKVATIVLKLSEAKEPPLRFLVGPDAVGYASKAAEILVASNKDWRDLSMSSN